MYFFLLMIIATAIFYLYVFRHKIFPFLFKVKKPLHSKESDPDDTVVGFYKIDHSTFYKSAFYDQQKLEDLDIRMEYENYSEKNIDVEAHFVTIENDEENEDEDFQTSCFVIDELSDTLRIINSEKELYPYQETDIADSVERLRDTDMYEFLLKLEKTRKKVESIMYSRAKILENMEPVMLKKITQNDLDNFNIEKYL